MAPSRTWVPWDPYAPGCQWNLYVQGYQRTLSAQGILVAPSLYLGANESSPPRAR